MVYLLAACAAPALPPFPTGNPAHAIAIAFAPASGLVSEAADEVAAQLGAKTGLAFKASTYSSTSDVVNALGSGKAQMGWVDALGYVVARKRHGVDVGLVAVRSGSDHFESQIIANVRAARSLGDLRGQTFCFASDQSIGGYVIPRIILQANGIDAERDLKVIKTKRDDQIAAAVYAGVDCVAGALGQDGMAGLHGRHPDAEEKVQALETTFPIPNDAVVFAQGFPEVLRAQVTEALDALAQTTNGRNALQVDGLIKRSDSAYDRLRDLLTKAGTDPAHYIQ